MPGLLFDAVRIYNRNISKCDGDFDVGQQRWGDVDEVPASGICGQIFEAVFDGDGTISLVQRREATVGTVVFSVWIDQVDAVVENPRLVRLEGVCSEVVAYLQSDSSVVRL